MATEIHIEVCRLILDVETSFIYFSEPDLEKMTCEHGTFHVHGMAYFLTFSEVDESRDWDGRGPGRVVGLSCSYLENGEQTKLWF